MTASSMYCGSNFCGNDPKLVKLSFPKEEKVVGFFHFLIAEVCFSKFSKDHLIAKLSELLNYGKVKWQKFSL